MQWLLPPDSLRATFETLSSRSANAVNGLVPSLLALARAAHNADPAVYFACLQNIAIVETTAGRCNDAIARLMDIIGELEALVRPSSPGFNISSARTALDGDAATAFNPTSSLLAAYGQLAILLAEKGAVDQATEYYHKGLAILRERALPAELATWCNNLAVLRMDVDDPDGAEPLLVEAMQCIDAEQPSMLPIHDALVFSMARCRALQHRCTEALTMLEALLDRETDSHIAIDALTLKAECLAGIGHPQQAITSAQRVLDTLNPTDERVRFLRGRVALACAHVAAGDASWIPALAAVASDFEASNLLPDAIRTYRLVARASELVGDAQGALDALRVATDRSAALTQRIANERSQVLSTLFQLELVRSRAAQAEAAAQVERLQHEKTTDVLLQVNEALLAHKAELAAFRTELANILSSPGHAEDKLRRLTKRLRDAPNMRDSWDHYVEVFAKAHPRFLRSIAERCPTLSAMEIRVCVLTRAGMTSEEIADVLCLSPRTIETHRLNIRKKFGLTGRASLSAFLSAM
jgi:DNA-binding CsgD family transcriptional regulator/tetratricopeptide (TPR) repeat protein